MKQDINMLLLQLEKVQRRKVINFLDYLKDNDVVITQNIGHIIDLLKSKRPNLSNILVTNEIDSLDPNRRVVLDPEVYTYIIEELLKDLRKTKTQQDTNVSLSDTLIPTAAQSKDKARKVNKRNIVLAEINKHISNAVEKGDTSCTIHNLPIHYNETQLLYDLGYNIDLTRDPEDADNTNITISWE
jgi:hypothetical protein